ncbi:hypothetical protein [Candidatus Nitrosocosmicus sp. T]
MKPISIHNGNHNDVAIIPYSLAIKKPIIVKALCNLNLIISRISSLKTFGRVLSGYKLLSLDGILMKDYDNKSYYDND